MKEISLTPHASTLMESTRSIGYSFESAIADLLDNSISAGAKTIEIKSPPILDPHLAIIDDGSGMTEDELIFAMRYGCIGPNEERHGRDLGRFGLGMKMASLSQCRSLTVLSKKNGRLSGYRWDLDKVIQTNNWILLELSDADIKSLPYIEILKKSDSGTIVYWNNLDRVIGKYRSIEEAMTDKLVNAKEHLALTFHRFLTGEVWPYKIRIILNNDELRPLDPFLSYHPYTRPHPEQIININGSEIKIKPYILPPVNKIAPEDSRRMGGKAHMKRMQGFYVYRNGRLIVPGNWFRLTGSTSLHDLARVRIDIPAELDFIWEIDVKKSSAILPESIRMNIIQFLDQVTTASADVYRYRGKKVKKDHTYVWEKIEERGFYRYEINRKHPFYVNLIESLPLHKLAELENFISLVESYLPFMSIHADLKSGEGRLYDSVVDKAEENKAIEKAKQIIEQGLMTVEELIKIEPFSYHSKKIIKEVGKSG